ncbi:histidine kinase [Dactylosporangium sp. CS-047395]|uniref:histidine kinase n=1 Tax=Dactylosporangium sp. CS-047395 TaxID=3239936 RepID=UPI003D8DD8EE
MAVQLEKADAFRDRDPEAAARAVTDARWSARQALAEVRDSVRQLRDDPPSLHELARHAQDVRLRHHAAAVGHAGPADRRPARRRQHPVQHRPTPRRLTGRGGAGLAAGDAGGAGRADRRLPRDRADPHAAGAARRRPRPAAAPPGRRASANTPRTAAINAAGNA